MKLYHKNPRQITKKQYEMLKVTLEELGDLSGVIHDLNSDESVGGNQRSRVFDINECEIKLTEEYDKPDKQGTVAWGFVVWKGNKYNYRQVRWTPGQCERANIIANKVGGDFDIDILADQFDLDVVLESGFEKFELGIIGESIDYGEMWQGMPEFEQEDLTSIQKIIVHFATHDDIDVFAELMEQNITDKTRSIWFPRLEKESLTDKVYKNES